MWANHIGYGFSDCEWLAGYIALRFLNQPELAAAHFVRFAQSVETPISLGRAGYWMGRAYEAMGDAETAQKAYAARGAHQTSFYGLLAAEKAGMGWDESLRGDEVFPDWRQAAWTTSSVHEAARLFLDAGELSLAERFWVHLSESQDRVGLGQMGTMAQELGAPHVAVMLGKNMVRALRFWMTATGLTEEYTEDWRTNQRLTTSFGQLVWEYDRYLEK